MGGSFQAVLFDLDGTLSDSAPGILTSLRHAFDVTGLPRLDPATERGLLGPPFYESLPPLIGGPERLPAVIAAYRERYGAGGMFDTAAYPGTRAILASLHRAGVRVAVATSKPEPFAVRILEHLGMADYLQTVGGDDLAGSRPSKALVIAEVFARLGTPDPADVIMVGDRRHDVEGARAHGVDCFAVEWGYAVPGELAAAAPVRTCADAVGLAVALSERFGVAVDAGPTNGENGAAD